MVLLLVTQSLFLNFPALIFLYRGGMSEHAVGSGHPPGLYPFISASEVVALVRRREVSCEQAVGFFLERIRAHNPGLNAVVQLNADAVEEARGLDQALAKGQEALPLHGLPVSIKSNLSVRCRMHCAWQQVKLATTWRL